jgi:hypothetical protein
VAVLQNWANIAHPATAKEKAAFLAERGPRIEMTVFLAFESFLQSDP